MKLYDHPRSDAHMKWAVEQTIGYRYLKGLSELVGFGYEFTGDDGFRSAGTIGEVNFFASRPLYYVRVVTASGLIEWQFTGPDGSRRWKEPVAYSHTFGGHTGTFRLTGRA